MKAAGMIGLRNGIDVVDIEDFDHRAFTHIERARVELEKSR